MVSGTVVCQFSNTVQDQVDNFFADGIMPASKVVCCIFFSTDQLFGMKELTVSASAHLIYNSRFLAGMAGRNGRLAAPLRGTLSP